MQGTADVLDFVAAIPRTECMRRFRSWSVIGPVDARRAKARIFLSATFVGLLLSPDLRAQAQDWFIPGDTRGPASITAGLRTTTTKAADIYRLQNGHWVIAGQVIAGTTLTVRQPPRQDGYVMILTPGGWEGLVHRDALRVSDVAVRPPGSPAPTSIADVCTGAGVTIRNGFVAYHPRRGANSITVENRVGQAGNIKLRDMQGNLVLSFYVGPEGRTTIAGVPDGVFRVSFLSAEKWAPSRRTSTTSPYEACGTASAQVFDGADAYQSTPQSAAHWTYTIFAVSHGNASTSPLDVNAFYRD